MGVTCFFIGFQAPYWAFCLITLIGDTNLDLSDRLFFWAIHSTNVTIDPGTFGLSRSITFLFNFCYWALMLLSYSDRTWTVTFKLLSTLTFNGVLQYLQWILRAPGSLSFSAIVPPHLGQWIKFGFLLRLHIHGTFLLSIWNLFPRIRLATCHFWILLSHHQWRMDVFWKQKDY